jgi:general secretion pathway protein K
VIFFNRNENKHQPGALYNETGGVALILVVWVIVVLTAIVGEFSFTMRTELNIARNFKEEEEAYQLALAGIEKAKLELLLINRAEVMYLDEEDMLMFGEEEEERPSRKAEIGKGSFEYKITDEDGKLNINTATEGQLKVLFLDSGIDVTDVDIIVDSIFDWRDKNELHRLNGAEEDYYKSLENPYSSKDGPFSTIEELLLVKGITKDVFYGSKDKEEDDEEYYKGVAQYLTVYGSNLININTAAESVLVVALGLTIAEQAKILRETGLPIYKAIGKSKVSSEYFTILSTGKNMDGSVKRRVKVVVKLLGNNLETLYWNDNFIG